MLCEYRLKAKNVKVYELKNLGLGLLLADGLHSSSILFELVEPQIKTGDDRH
jgi:hypothetical protein